MSRITESRGIPSSSVWAFRPAPKSVVAAKTIDNRKKRIDACKHRCAGGIPTIGLLAVKRLRKIGHKRRIEPEQRNADRCNGKRSPCAVCRSSDRYRAGWTDRNPRTTRASLSLFRIPEVHDNHDT